MAVDGRFCSSCNIYKSIDNFGINNANKHGREYSCRLCLTFFKKKRRLAKLEHYKKKEREQRKKWRIENPERNSELKKQSKIRTSYRRFKKNQCESCGFLAIDSCQLDVDHIDGNKNNNDQDNLQTLCANCHRLKTKLNKDNRVYAVKLKLVGEA